MNISDTDLTPQEMQRLSEALKNEEFKSLFLDYVKEISDPENRKLYEAELVALEAEQGRDLTFVNPEPLFCVKTSDSHGLKVFINICSSDAINEAVAKKSGKGSHWSIPYSLGSPRDDVDAGQKTCKVYDAVFHSKTLSKCASDSRFKELIISTAIEGIEKQFKTVLDKKYKLPKLKVKGVIPSTVIRVKKESKEEIITKAETSSEYLAKILENQKNVKYEDTKDVKMQGKKAENKIPEYTIVHQGVISDYTDFTNAREKSGTRPDVLLLKVKLPKVESISQIELDTFEKCVELIVPGIYEVQISLPFSVVHDEGTAKFDKVTKELSVSLPVIKPKFSKPDKVLIEEVEDDQQDAASGDPGKCIEEALEPCTFDNTGLDKVVHDQSSIEQNNYDGINAKKVPIFHMRQDMSTVSFMIPQYVKKDDSKIQFEEDSVMFDFLQENDSYHLHIKFQDKVIIEASNIEIKDSHTLILLTKEEHKDWDFVTVYSQGRDYDRRFSKIMSEAENELWRNPSEILKYPDVQCSNSAREGIVSDAPISDQGLTKISAPANINDSPPLDHQTVSNNRKQMDQIPNTPIDKGQESRKPTGIQTSSANEGVAGTYSNTAEIIKNSYLFELDD